MVNRFVAYWINNKKIMRLALAIVALRGAGGWIVLPKQYNPDIVMPAFQIMIPAPGYTAKEVQSNIIQPLERGLKEIQDIDTTQSVAATNYAASVIMFEVGTNKEDAYTRLINKLESHKNNAPIGVSQYQITSFDPDDIPIFTLAIASSGEAHSSNQTRLIALDIIEQLKNINEVGAMSIVGGETDNITIEIDPDAVEQQGVDVMQIYDIIKNNNIRSVGGKYRTEGSINTLTIDGSIQDIEDIENLIVTSIYDTPVYIKDIASVRYGEADTKNGTLLTTDSDHYINPVFIGVAKKKGTNAVEVVKKIRQELTRIEKQLPQGYMIETIQDEGKTAEQATSRLLHELFSSVIVLFIVMFLFMGRRDALSSSISIPLVLGITFGISLLLGDNVNRITLFALILVLGMLVDDSIIVVENISRHIKQWDKKTNSLLPIILKATGEIGGAALFSTITKIVAFLGMFFVSGMMGQYMSPIPKYAIIALSVSLIVAFSVNPFLSYIFAIADQKAKDKTDSPLTKITQTLQKNLHPLTTIFHYLYLRILTYRESIHNFISRFIPLSRTKETSVPFLDRYEQLISSLLKHEAGDKRKYLKKVFWVVLAVLLITLPALGVFRWRMLPKSNVNQIYLWINADTDSSIDATQQLATDVNQRLSSYTIKNTNKDVPSSHHIIDTVSYWIGMAPTADFSNSFRGSAMRQQENNISMRINLMDKEHRNLSSEQFVLDLRPKLQSWINKHYPRAEFRLLEDPPGPPVKATWMLKVQSSTTTPQNLINTTANRLYQKLQQDLFIYDVVDHDSSIDRQPQSMEIKIDHEAIARAGLSVNQVAHTLYSLFEGIAVNTYHNPEAKEPLSIFIKVKNLITDYDSISFTNPQGQKVPLRTIATISPSTNNQIYYFDDGKPTTYLYGELGNNSVIYPMIDFLSKATNDAFREGRFHVEHRNLYEIQLRELGTDISYTISFGGERELSMDTFKDLGVALGLTLFMLYIIVSVRFNGFGIGGIVMLPFLFGFVGILPGYSILYFLTNEYFSATSMIGVIALAGISIGNSIILLEYVEELRHKGMDMRDALPLASKTRLKPIFLTSVTAIIGALMIIGDPVWSGLAWSIIRGLSVSAILTLILIPVFVYENHNKDHR